MAIAGEAVAARLEPGKGPLGRASRRAIPAHGSDHPVQRSGLAGARGPLPAAGSRPRAVEPGGMLDSSWQITMPDPGDLMRYNPNVTGVHQLRAAQVPAPAGPASERP